MGGCVSLLKAPHRDSPLQPSTRWPVTEKQPRVQESETEARQHLIFLSHSGQEKPFVRKLDSALRNAGHDPFFDTHSLPLGERFPPHIKRNAQGCRLGVVVLSPGFLTSKWPMTELHMMLTSPSPPQILPLFYKVQPNDLKPSGPRFSQWKDEWQMMANKQHPSRVHIREWGSAVTHLSTINGVVYDSTKGEDSFIQEALHRICGLVRPPPRYDVSSLAGCERLTQEVVTLFKGTQTHPHLKARVLGFHGIGGQGKTAICKLMMNYYADVYAGRCALIEFPSYDFDKAHILNQCKKALWQLTNISEDRIRYVDDFDQCLQLMKERVASLNVFIVMDNLWETSLEYAQRILDLGFSKDSKIMVTSRSGEVLVNLLRDRSCVRSLPSVNKEEAHQIFINFLNRNQPGQSPDAHPEMDDMVHCHRYKDGYHPLAIKTLGVILGRTSREKWPATLDEVDRFRTDSMNAVNEVININYDTLLEVERDVFLDIALVYIPEIQRREHKADLSYVFGFPEINENFDNLHTWLSVLYRGILDEYEINRTLRKLSSAGLLEFRDCLTFMIRWKEVQVHDLYQDLAIQKAAANGRFFLDQEIFRRKGIQCGEVEKIVWCDNGVTQNQSMLSYRGIHLPKLQSLLMDSEYFGWRLEDMPCLRVLKLRADGTLMGWRNTPHLSWLEVEAIQEIRIESISELSHLRVLQLTNARLMSTRLCLNDLVNLQVLGIHGGNIEEITGLSSLTHLSVINLRHLSCLRKVGVFSRHSKQLQVVDVLQCDLLEELEGVGDVPNLEALYVSAGSTNFQLPISLNKSLKALFLGNCVKSLPNLEGMTDLIYLFLGCEDEFIVRIHGLPNLKRIDLGGMVKEIHFPSGLPKVERLEIFKCPVLKKIDWSILHVLTNLKEVGIRSCPVLENGHGDPNGIRHTLQKFTIKDCPHLEEVRRRR